MSVTFVSSFFVILFSLNAVEQATAENIYSCLHCADHVNCLLNTTVLRAFQLFYHAAFWFNKLHEESF